MGKDKLPESHVICRECDGKGPVVCEHWEEENACCLECGQDLSDQYAAAAEAWGEQQQDR